MKNQALARRYAQALLALGREDGQYQAYRQELARVSQLLTAAQAFQTLDSPLVLREARQKILAAILEKLALAPLLANFLRLLLDKGRFGYLPEISRSYGLLVDEADGVKEAHLVAAKPLTQADQEAVARALAEFSGATIRLTVEEDPDLIGGVIATIGDLVIDGSVRTQIRNLTRALSAS